MRLFTSPQELFAAAAARSRGDDDDDDDDDTDEDYDEPAFTGGQLGLRGGGKQGKSTRAPQAWGGLQQLFLFSSFDRHTSRSAPSPRGAGVGPLDGWAGRWGESHLKAELLVCLSYV